MSVWDRLDEIQVRADKATDGPWRVGGEGSEGSRVYTDTGDKRADSRALIKCNGRVQPEDGHNAEFIAHARTDVPALVAALEAALDACAEIRANNTGTDLRAGGAAAAVIIEVAIENKLKENQ